MPESASTEPAKATRDQCQLICGKAIAKSIQDEVKLCVRQLAQVETKTNEDHLCKTTNDSSPYLVVIIVGDRKDSQVYVGRKVEACSDCGIQSTVIRCPADISEEELLGKICALNQDTTVHGILVQLPLPGHLDERKIVRKIEPAKDVDGLHPENAGYLFTKQTAPLKIIANADEDGLGLLKRYSEGLGFNPCTAEAVVEICLRSSINLRGATVVIVGRSTLVGLPAAILLQQQDATVTICHSKTKDLAAHCRGADVIVVAIGNPNFIKADWVRPEAAIIDVGINAVPDATTKKGYKLCGDVDFSQVVEKAGRLTPVPGGVGPVTVAILMRNTLRAKLRTLNQSAPSACVH